MSGNLGCRESVYGLGITPGLGFITGPEGQKAEREALRKDQSQARRVVVSLVGRERQGKTSLRRLLAGEPFNKEEPSTVGLEKQLVETQALEPGSGTRSDWKTVILDNVNTEEFHEVLGRRIHHRLESQRHRIPRARRGFNALITMVKIGIIGYFSLFLFFFISSKACTNFCPTWGLTLVVMFVFCGLAFGKRDGFGIAVGVCHLMILCESLVRWRIAAQFEEFRSTYGTTGIYLLGAVCCGLMEGFMAICLGLSLGLGMACVFCLSRPDNTDYFRDGHPLLQLEVYMLIASSLIGLAFVQNKYARPAIPLLLVPLLFLLPAQLSFAFVCGTTIGVVHGPFLIIGRSFFLVLNCVIKRVTKTLFGRHIVRHCVGLLPGLLVAYGIFGWRLVTSPLSAVLAHVMSAVLLIAVNEIDVAAVHFLLLRLWISSSSTSSSSFQYSLSSSAASSSSSSSLSSPSEQYPNSRTNNFSSSAQPVLHRPRSDSSCLATEQPTSVLASSTSSLSSTPRIMVRDFAGHPLYYSAHHVYMTAHCVYVLVFSLKEARRDFQLLVRNLINWLQSIFLHTGFPDTRVLLVGTHRDDQEVQGKLEEDFVGCVGQKLRKMIPRHFHNMLVWNEQDTPLFPVENSIRDHRDKDHRNLRQQILKTVQEVNAERFPVRYFYFFVVLDQLRSTKKLLIDTDALLTECQENHCAIKDRDDMDAMLLLFQRLGEILYFPEDNLLQSVVVLSPHAVLDILSRLIDVPKMADRHRRLLNEWEMLEFTGICSRRLFQHILHLHAKELLAQSDTVIYLLQTLNLVCALRLEGRCLSNFNNVIGNGSHTDGLRYRGKHEGDGNDSYQRARGEGGQNGAGGGGGGDRRGADGKKTGDDDESNDENSDDDDKDQLSPQREPTEHDESAEAELFLVPSALPLKLPHEHCTWTTRSGDWQLLVDGLPVLPHAAFLRLLSVCVTQDACTTQDHLGCPQLTVSQSSAAFTFGRKRCYKLEWMTTSEVAHTYHGRLLKIVVAEEDEEKAISSIQNVLEEESFQMNHTGNFKGSDFGDDVSPQVVVNFVWRSLSEIIRRDFRRCHLRLGVACPCSAPHQVPCEETEFHFLTLTDTREVTTALDVPVEKEFWCRGRHVIYRKGKVFESSRRRSRPDVYGESPGSLPVLSIPLCCMPQRLHASICDLLDVPHALGNDWTALAGKLGKTVRQVELLRFRNPRDPCDALLQDWASREPAATIGHLVSIMRSIQRFDVVKTVEDFSV